jgi:uncharacterized membrane protein YfcA
MALLFDTLALIAAFAAAGAFAGLLSGALRVGGGAAVAPLILAFLDGGAALAPVATGTALVAVLLLSGHAALAHRRLGALETGLLLRWGPFAALGGSVGGWGASSLAPGPLAVAVGLAACAAGLIAALVDQKARAAAPPLGAGGMGAAFALGAVSAATGNGGGAFASLALRLAGLDARRAAGAAAGLGAMIAAPAALAFALAPTAPPALSVGAVNPAGAVVVALAAAFAAPYGARLAAEGPGGVVRVGAALAVAALGLATVRLGVDGWSA